MQKVNGKGYLLQEEEEEEEEEATIGTGIQDHFAGGLRYS
jgi:hypothetical protein